MKAPKKLYLIFAVLKPARHCDDAYFAENGTPRDRIRVAAPFPEEPLLDGRLRSFRDCGKNGRFIRLRQRSDRLQRIEDDGIDRDVELEAG